MGNQLYQHQIDDVAWATERRSYNHNSHWITSEPGTGKSISACAIAAALRAENILIVCPAGVRPNWKAIVGTWLPQLSHAAILKGPRKADSKPEQFRMTMLRTANVQIVTPDLLSTVDQDHWDMVVFDEMHQLVSARAKLYQELRDMREGLPGATFLGLSGTPLSTDPVQVWTLLDIFWPGLFGKRQANGDPPHKWKMAFQNSVPSEYSRSGFAFSGLRDDAAPKLRAILNSVSRRVLREDLGAILPPVDFRAGIIPFEDTSSDLELAISKLDVLCSESAHVGAFTVHHEPGRALQQALALLPRYRDVAVAYLDGTYSAEQRAATLAHLRSKPRSLLIGTIGAMGIGVDLTYIQQYLIAEPMARAPEVIQLDGRFRRLSNLGAPAAIGHMNFREGRDDADRELLVSRMKSYEAALRTAKGSQALREAFTIQDSPDRMDRMFDRLLAGFRGDVDSTDLEDDDNDDT